jgi:hypothetical protein
MLAVLLLAACSSRTTVPRAASLGACPPLEELGPYAYELFPACQPPPLPYKVDLCGGARCASPCSQAWTRPEGSGVATFTYDANGRLAASTINGTVRTCSYDGAGRMLQSCDGHARTAERDATGKLVEIDGRVLVYDAAGRLVRLGDAALTYDAAGHVIAFGTSRYAWTGDRLAAEYFGDDNDDPMRYAYDARGFLASVTDEADSIQFEFQGDRLVTVRATSSDGVSTTTFRYDCR